VRSYRAQADRCEPGRYAFGVVHLADAGLTRADRGGAHLADDNLTEVTWPRHIRATQIRTMHTRAPQTWVGAGLREADLRSRTNAYWLPTIVSVIPLFLAEPGTR
jgi:hypothetical protein